MSDVREDLGYTGPLKLEPDPVCVRCGRKPDNGFLVAVPPSTARDHCRGCARSVTTPPRITWSTTDDGPCLGCEMAREGTAAVVAECPIHGRGAR